MKAVPVGLLVAFCLGCGGGEGGGEPFGVYHLEGAIGRPGAQGELRCGPPRQVCPGVVEQPPPSVFRYRVHAEPALTGDDIDRSTVRRATEPGTGTPLVLIDLTAEGREAFARVTFEAARVGGRDQVWHHVAIVVGDEIVSFPEIDFDEHPDGIPSVSSLQVSAVDVADARDLVRRLRDE